MHLLGLTSWLLVGHLVHGYSPGIDFIGIGYNLLKANPEGGAGSAGGVDPGLNVVRQILQLTSGTVPKEVVYQGRHSCLYEKSTHVYYGTKSYQKRFGFGVESSDFNVTFYTLCDKGQGNGEVASAAFSLSAGYKKAYSETNKNGNVNFDEETICNLGTARFSEELSLMHTFHVTSNFAAAVCKLPAAYHDTPTYMKFLDDWGTHVIMEVDFGTKVINRYQSSLSEFIKHVQKHGGVGLSVEGSYMGFGASLGVDFSRFKGSSTYKLQFGTKASTLTSGTTSQPEPVRLVIKTIAEALDSDYWQGPVVLKACGHSLSDLQSIRKNIVKALTTYAKYKLFTPPTDPQLRIPLTWPSGTYGLIKASTGCPSSARFPWHEGSRHQGGKGPRPHPFPLHQHIVIPDISVNTDFCIKADSKITQFDTDWPAGDYCILKYGACPKGFKAGSIYWDDPNNGNTNSKKGVLPDGQYTADTRIDYCCRNDALPTERIMLPTEKPFVLLKYTRACQEVYGMGVYESPKHWNVGDHDSSSGAHPYDDGGAHYHTLHYCYYHAHKSGSVIG